MQLPMRVFWLYSNSIDRIKAYDDRRLLKVAICSQSGEAAQGLIEELNKELGDVVKGPVMQHDPAVSKAGIAELRMLM